MGPFSKKSTKKEHQFFVDFLENDPINFWSHESKIFFKSMMGLKIFPKVHNPKKKKKKIETP